MSIERYVKDRIKRMKYESEVFHIGKYHYIIKKVKKFSKHKYLVTLVEDPFFFDLYETVVMDKYNLIKLLIHEYNEIKRA